MRLLLLLTLLAAPALCTDQTESKKSAPKASEAKEETVLTPFGRVKKQAPAPKPTPRPGAAASMVDVEVADGVATFKRKTPFGVQSWKRPLDQLSADEKKLLEESREAAAASAPQTAPEPEKKAGAEPR